MSKHIIYISPHTPIPPQNNFILFELSVPLSVQDMNPLHLELHALFVLLFLKLQSTCGNRIGTVEERKFRIMGVKNKGSL